MQDIVNKIILIIVKEGDGTLCKDRNLPLSPPLLAYTVAGSSGEQRDGSPYNRGRVRNMATT